MVETGSSKEEVMRKFMDTKSIGEVLIDNYLLIKEVKKKPVIYDKSVKNTNENSAMKRQAWVEVAAKVYSEYWAGWNAHQKDKALGYAQKRWTNIRTCFHREIRIQKKTQSTCRRKYIYYDILQFLTKRNQSSETNDRESDDDEDDAESNESNSDGEEQEATLIDNEEFIREVEKRPTLYDKSLQNTSAEDRKQCWSEICAKVFDDWVDWDTDRQDEAVKELQKRWHNLRNCFLREIRLQKRKPLAKRRKYVYYNSMQFLLGHCGLRGLSLETQKRDDFEFKQEYYDPDPVYFEIDMEQEEPTSSSSTQNPRKRERSNIEEVIIDDPLQVVKEGNSNVDHEMNFALSIVPMLKALPLGVKLQVQIEILKLFQKATSTT